MNIEDVKFIHVHVSNQTIELLDADKKNIAIYKWRGWVKVTGGSLHATEYEVKVQTEE